MKKLFLTSILLLGIITLTQAQDREHKFAFTLMPSYGLELKEFSIGTSIEYQMNVIYVKAQVFKTSYGTEIGGVPLGFNYHQPRWNNYRIYAGLKLAVLIIDTEPNAIAGIETGFDINITDTFFIGPMVEFINRQDGKFHGKNDEGFNDTKFLLKIGFRF